MASDRWLCKYCLKCFLTRTKTDFIKRRSVIVHRELVFDLARYIIMNWMKPASPFDFSAANTRLFGNQAVSCLLANPRERTKKQDIGEGEASSEDPQYETRAVSFLVFFRRARYSRLRVFRFARDFADLVSWRKQQPSSKSLLFLRVSRWFCLDASHILALQLLGSQQSSGAR